MWSYGNSAGEASSCPGPTLCVEAGKTVTVVLHNTLPEATSIVFPGQKGVKANGNPAQPQLDTGGSLTSLVQPARRRRTAPSPTRSPPAARAPTSTRAAPTSTSRCRWASTARSSSAPPGTPARSTTAPTRAFNPEHEYVFLLSEVDPDLHLAVERREPIDWKAYQPATT